MLPPGGVLSAVPEWRAPAGTLRPPGGQIDCPRSAKRLTKADMRELEQEEIHHLSELAQDLQMRLGAARHRIAELESNR